MRFAVLAFLGALTLASGTVMAFETSPRNVSVEEGYGYEGDEGYGYEGDEGYGYGYGEEGDDEGYGYGYGEEL